MECLQFADINTRFFAGRFLGKPRCPVAAPPMNGYWAALRSDLLSRPPGTGPYLARTIADLSACKPALDACY